jgi:RNA polymerase sigma-70 factor (ECF subfamily)
MFQSDDVLIEGCKGRDRHMQEELYQKYSKSMYVVALRYSRMQQEAEDILQEAFVKVFQSIDRFRGESSLPYWIKRIVINTALNHQRSKLYLYPMVDVDELRNQGKESNILSDLEYAELLKMVQSLPDGCRIIFNLYAIEGFKHQEIGTMLEISEGTSKSQYARAKSLLQKKVLNRYGVDYDRRREYGG